MLFKVVGRLAAILLMSLTSAAQASGDMPVADPNDRGIVEIVISAHRTNLDADLVSSSVSIIDRAAMDAKQSIYVTDLLKRVPGLAVNRVGSFGSQTQVRMRGAEANHVLVLIDGIKANDPTGGDEFPFASLTTYSLQSLEVVRGPQSALWGSEAVAGTIHLTTRLPKEKSAFNVSLEGGSFGSFTGGGQWSTNLKEAQLALGASRHSTNGTRTAATGVEKDGNENTALFAKAGWQPVSNTDFEATARYTETETEFDDYDFATTGLPADADREEKSHLLLLGLLGKTSSNEGFWNQMLQLTFLDSNRVQFSSETKGESVLARRLGIRYQSEFNMSGMNSSPINRLVIAIDHEKTKFEQRGEILPWGNPNQKQSLKNTGFITEYVAQPLKHLTVSANLRYDVNSEFKDIFTYRFAANQQLLEQRLRLRGSYGKAQKAPTFIERFGYFFEQFQGNPGLKPEHTNGYEIGLSASLLNGNLKGNLTYFNETLENEINGFFFDTNLLGFTAINMGGESHRKGWEFEIILTLDDVSTVRASYTKGRYTQISSERSSVEEVRRPEHLVSLNWDLRLGKRTRANLNLYHASKQHDLFFAPPTFLEERVMLDGYTLVDISLSRLLKENLSIYARAENLFDKKYSDVLGFEAPGRGIYAGVKFRL